MYLTKETSTRCIVFVTKLREIGANSGKRQQLTVALRRESNNHDYMVGVWTPGS